MDKPLVATCFDCDRRFNVFKNDRLCPECEQAEWARRRSKCVVGKSRKPRSLAARVSPVVVEVASFAMRLHGKRAAAHG